MRDGSDRVDDDDDAPPPPPSPCIHVCKLDPDQAWCVGCGRSYDEQRGWTRLDAAARAAIQEDLPRRLAALGPRRRLKR